MTKTEIVCEAFSVGQQVAGPTLGIPFFIGSLFVAGGLTQNGATWGKWAIGYMLFVVFPAAACLSSAMATSVAPMGQEKSYARSSAFGYLAVLLSFGALLFSLSLYAFWPFASGQDMWRALSGSRFGLPIATLLGSALLVLGFAVLGYTVGRYTRHHSGHLMARILRFCWKLSRKKLSDTATMPFS